jgi:GH24 family phage-related lysozyme (muramidase)
MTEPAFKKCAGFMALCDNIRAGAAVMNQKFLLLISFVTATLLICLVPLSPAFSQNAGCYLAAHDDVICPRGDEPSPGTETIVPLDFAPSDTSGTPPVYLNGTTAPVDLGGGSGGGGGVETSSGYQCNGSDPIGSAEANIKAREGNGLPGAPYHGYLDSLGKPTICYGHLIVPGDGLSVNSQLTEQQCDTLFNQDFQKYLTAAQQQMQAFGICYGCFIVGLTAVDYQLGTGWETEFPQLSADLMAGNYTAAIQQVLNSAWNSETPTRTQDFISAIRALPPKGSPCGSSSSTGDNNAPTAQ